MCDGMMYILCLLWAAELLRYLPYVLIGMAVCGWVWVWFLRRRR